MGGITLENYEWVLVRLPVSQRQVNCALGIGLWYASLLVLLFSFRTRPSRLFGRDGSFIKGSLNLWPMALFSHAVGY